MGKEGLRANAAVCRTTGRIVVTAKDLAAKFEIGFGGCDPAQLHAVITVLIAEKRLVGQRPVAEIIRVRVLTVEIANV